MRIFKYGEVDETQQQEQDHYYNKEEEHDDEGEENFSFPYEFDEAWRV